MNPQDLGAVAPLQFVPAQAKPYTKHKEENQTHNMAPPTPPIHKRTSPIIPSYPIHFSPMQLMSHSSKGCEIAQAPAVNGRISMYFLPRALGLLRCAPSRVAAPPAAWPWPWRPGRGLKRRSSREEETSGVENKGKTWEN